MSTLSAKQKRRRPLRVTYIIGSLLILSSASDLHAQAEAPCAADNAGKYIVKKDESLSLIALRCYGDPSLWKRIANENRIEKPRHLPSGIGLTLPSDLPRLSAAESSALELAFWRAHFSLQKQTTDDPSVTRPSVSVRATSQEFSVIQASNNPDPAPALKATRGLLQNDPELVSARIAEIKLLVKAGKTAEAELRARALISAHPELKEIPKIRAWAKLPEGTTSEHEDYSR